MPIPGLRTKKYGSSWRRRPIRKYSRRKSRKLKGQTMRKFFIIIIFLILLAGVIITGGLAWLSHDLPSPEKLSERSIAQSTTIYDRTGKISLYEIFASQRRTLIDLSEIPRDLVFTTIVSEDKDFFRHAGFDFKAIIRAFVINILRGGKVQGGSTLTQQFIKNALLTPQKTYIRKIKELFLAWQIEKKFSKEEILQMYFNEIPYGSNAYGAEAASQIYFAKSVRDLTLDEAALLAALPKAPTYYSPNGSHLDELLARQHHILDLMAEESYVPQERADQAKEIDTLKKVVPRHENIIAPHFVMYVKGLLTEKYGHRLVEQGGLKVITTLDVEKQKIAEEAIEIRAENNEKNFGATNAALVSLDVENGQILAMVGSKDFFDESIDGQVNVVTRSRQPGSSFKPIVYAAAFEKGFTPQTIIFDVETNFGPAGPEEEYIPQNYDGTFRGPVTMRQALAGSLNVPGVKTLYLTGLDNALNLAQRMGYTTLTDKSRYGLSLVLGGGEIKLLEHTAAFGILAREGKRIPTISVLKVEDNQGKILEEKNPELLLAQEVIAPQITRLINNILSDNQARSFVFGESNYLTLGDRPVCAKTGTTNDFRDAWTIGYTPSLVTGVWVGNNRNEAMKDKADGANVAAPIWHEFMQKALAGTPPESFNPPESIEVKKPILRGELPGEITLKIDKASKKLATDLTPASFVAEKIFKGYHPILYYVNKNNPQGPAPKNPTDDPQYDFWTEGIEKWLKEKSEEIPGGETGISLELAPTEYDDLHIPANQPTLTILSPKSGTVINKQILELELSASSPRGVRRIVCAADNIPLGTAYNPPYKCSLNLAGLTPGRHKIKTTAFDDIDNSKSQEIWVTTSQVFEEKITWLTPQNNQVVWQENFPLTLSILAPARAIKIVRFFAQNLETNQTNLLGTIFEPETSGQLNLVWTSAESGKYKLWIEAVDLLDNLIPSEEIEIKIK